MGSKWSVSDPCTEVICTELPARSKRACATASARMPLEIGVCAYWLNVFCTRFCANRLMPITTSRRMI